MFAPHVIYSLRSQALHDDIKHEHLRLELVASRLREECWEAMSHAKGASVTGMRSGIGVCNFSLLTKDDAKLKKVCAPSRAPSPRVGDVWAIHRVHVLGVKEQPFARNVSTGVRHSIYQPWD